MFLNRTDVTRLTLPLYSTPVNRKTSFMGFAIKLCNFSSLGRNWALVFACVFLFSCSEISQPDAYDQVYDVFGNMEHEEEFWQEIDTLHMLIDAEGYAQAKARLLKIRESTQNVGHQTIIRTISHKINLLQRLKGDAVSVLYREKKATDPYLHSDSKSDLMLAYNLASSYVKNMAKKLESIEFPETLEKRKHVRFHKGVYKIRSFANIYTASGKKLESQFACDIKVHKDRKNFTIQFLEISK